MGDAIEEVPAEAPKPKKAKKSKEDQRKAEEEETPVNKKAKEVEEDAPVSVPVSVPVVMSTVSSLERAVLRLVSTCDDRKELAETLMDTSDSAVVVSKVLLKLSTSAPAERSESELHVFKALASVLCSDRTTHEIAALAAGSVPLCAYGNDADELSTALLRTALRFPALAKSCADIINTIRGHVGFEDVSWPKM